MGKWSFSKLTMKEGGVVNKRVILERIHIFDEAKQMSRK
jgi:hypothetical protein